jgi:hypothetical protein
MEENLKLCKSAVGWRNYLKKDKMAIHLCRQGLGASVWWPNKDHMYDEVDNTH